MAGTSDRLVVMSGSSCDLSTVGSEVRSEGQRNASGTVCLVYLRFPICRSASRCLGNHGKHISTPEVVTEFYRRIWTLGDLGAVSELLTTDFSFRGSLGMKVRVLDDFRACVRSVRSALADYDCAILACVTEGSQAFAQMRFSGRPVGSFRGYRPMGKVVQWQGAALFGFDGRVIASLWVLGDLKELDDLLSANESAQAAPAPDLDRTARPTAVATGP